MKRIIFLLILSLTSSLASVDEIKSKLISTIARALIPSKNISLYVEDKSYENLKNLAYKIYLTGRKEKANLILAKKSSFMGQDTILFLTSYKEYLKTPKAVGALFWQKGRPNLIFNADKLEELNIQLPQELKKYIE